MSDMWVNTRTGEQFTVTATRAGLSWYMGADGVMRHSTCDAEVYSLEDGLICSKCSEQSDDPA